MSLFAWLPIALLLFVVQHHSLLHSSRRRYCSVPLCTTITPSSTQNNIDIDPVALEIVPLESVLNFRRALPGTNLPIYRCAAFDNASANDVVSLQSISTIIDLRNTDEIVKGKYHEPQVNNRHSITYTNSNLTNTLIHLINPLIHKLA